MRNLFGTWYALYLVGLLAVLSLARTSDGAVILLSFGGDAVHLVQIVSRMQMDQVPSVDFLTPVGALAFLPFHWLLNSGFSLGGAVAYASVFWAVITLPITWWLGQSRLGIWSALAFGTVTLVMWTAYVHGGDGPTVALSMYYNNWGWAIVSLVALAAFTAPRGDRWLVAVVIGAGIGALALIKAPFAAYVAPAVVVSLAIERRWAELLGAFAAGLVLLIVVSVPLGGVAYWQAYIQDLLTVAKSEVRASPGADLVGMVLEPRHFVLFLGLLAALLFLRQAGRNSQALVFLLLGAGFFAITHQNWQNDPHWVLIFGLLLLVEASRVELLNRYGWDLRRALQFLAAGFLVFAAQGFVLQAQSLMAHSGLAIDGSVALLDDDPTLRVRLAENPAVNVFHPAKDAADKTVFLGKPLPFCEKDNGLIWDLQASGAALDALVDTRAKTAFHADWVNALWLWSDLDPLPGGAPWYYGGLPGLEAADYLVVPLCPMGRKIRNLALRAVEESGLSFKEIARDDRMIVYEKR